MIKIIVAVGIVLAIIVLLKHFLDEQKVWKVPDDSTAMPGNSHIISSCIPPDYNIDLDDIPIDLFTGMDNYRLGDVFRHIHLKKKFTNEGLQVWGRSNTSTFEGTLKDYTLKHFPDTLAGKYLQNSQKPQDFPVLLDLCQQMDIQAPPADSLVIHLRVGDVIDHSRHTPEEFLLSSICENAKSACYVTSLPEIMGRVEKFKNTYGVKDQCDVILVAGAHVPGPHPKSRKYIGYIREKLRRENFRCTVRAGSHPDEDFAFMTRSKYFCSARGGFSSIIALLVKMQNNTVIE